LFLGYSTLTCAGLKDSKAFPANSENNLTESQIGNFQYGYFQYPNLTDYMKNWALLGPIQLIDDNAALEDIELLKPLFEKDFLKSYGGEQNLVAKPGISYKIEKNQYTWQLFEARQNVVDLTTIFGRKEGAVAYAFAEIVSPDDRKVLLSIGSNDAIKVWMNGELVHENWIFRAAHTDDADLAEAKLHKGKNRILLKVMNGYDTWGFLSKIFRSYSLNNHLRMEVRASRLDKVKKLVENGADINSTGREGATALHFAKIKGNKDIISYLISQGADEKRTFPPKGNLITRLLSRGIQSGSPGAAVLVAQNGKIVFQSGYGSADRKNYKRITTETKFRIGSITKQFTASAILLLQEQGKLRVEDRLSKFIPDYPRGGEVTLHHLLTHTSGIHNYTSKPKFWETVTDYRTPEEMIEFFKHDPYDFNPGERWSYSNSGYFLLGYIVEKVSGQSYSDFLKNQIFTPLAMHNSGIHGTELLTEEALGYSYKNNKVEKALNWDMSASYAAGAIYSTVTDLYLWNEAVFNSKVLNTTSLKAAFTPVPQDGRKPGDNLQDTLEEGYGYGWVIYKHRGLKVIGHSGGLHGFQSHISRYPDENLTIVVLANASPPHQYVQPNSLAKRIAEFYLWKEMDSYEIPKTIYSVDPKVYKAYVGQYVFSGGGILTISIKNNVLEGKIIGQKKLKLQPTGDHKFFVKDLNVRLHFIQSKDGEVNEIVLITRNGRQIARRMEEQKVVKVSPSLYDAYVGEYDYGHKRILTITKKGDRLFAKMTDQPKFEIFPKSDKEFFWKVVNAQIKFVINNNGVVIKAIHYQGGSYLEVKKLLP
jgi:CubicO group peptidase (beta-lactamase class C family)